MTIDQTIDFVLTFAKIGQVNQFMLKHPSTTVKKFLSYDVRNQLWVFLMTDRTGEYLRLEQNARDVYTVPETGAVEMQRITTRIARRYSRQSPINRPGTMAAAPDPAQLSHF